MNKLLKKVLLGAFAVCLSLGVFTACSVGESETPPESQTPPSESQTPPSESETTVYTVTVECTGATLPSTVGVRIAKDATVVKDLPITDGKAECDLATDTYTASLTLLPADFEYVSESTATLTPDAPAATISVRKKVKAVNVAVTLRNTATKDLFDREFTPAAPADMTVELFASEDALTAAAKGKTDTEGKYTFEGLTLGVYYAKVNGIEAGTLEVGETTTEANVEVNFPGGSKYAPLTWTVGENEVPFTEEILTSLGKESVYFSLTVDETALYSFDTDKDNKNANVSCVTGDAIQGWLIGTTHVTANLKADVAYLFACSSASSAETDFGYKVTIAKGNTGSGDDTPISPFEGNGTEGNPYVITKLKGNYSIQIKYEEGAYIPVYFTYTETTGAKYAIYTSDEDLFLTVNGGAYTDKHYGGGGKPSDKESLFETADNTKYTFVLTPYDEEEKTTVTVDFTIGDYEGWIPKWKGSGKFSKTSGYEVDDPYIIEELTDTYNVMVSIDGVYFKYEATETKKYTISTTDTYSFGFSVRNYNDYDPQKAQNYPVSASSPADFTLNANTTYIFYLSSNYSAPGQEIWTVLQTFEIKESETGSEPVEPVEPDGTEEHPYAFEPVLGEHSYEATKAGTWYAFTATEDAVYIFTTTSVCFLKINGKQLYQMSVNKPATYNLTVQNGTVYTVFVQTFGGAESATVTFTVTKKDDATPDGGSAAGAVSYLPDSETAPFAFQSVAQETDQAVTFPEAMQGTWVCTGTDGDEDVSTIPELVIGASSVSWGDKSVTVLDESEGSYLLEIDGTQWVMLIMALGSEQQLMLHSDSDDTGVTYSFEKVVNEIYQAVTFPEVMQGTWVCTGTDGDEDVSTIPELVIGASSVSWGDKSVTVLDESTGSYLLEIDGTQWVMLLVAIGSKQQLMLHSDDTDVTYSFEKVVNETYPTVAFPEVMQGTWVCTGTDGDEDVSTIPELVIGASSVSWGDKSVTVLDESTGSYLLEIDGTQWVMLLVAIDSKQQLMLHSDDTDVTYSFEKQA